MTHPVIADVTARIAERSAEQRNAYLNRLAAAAETGPARGRLACANLAHGFAASGTRDKSALRRMVKPNIAIVSSYNDMLSAHKPFESYPAQLKQAVLEAGGIAQFAGGVPAMCDGITQGRDGMQLSLFSRDVIAMATAIALSHDMFDGALLLGVCDKIVPGMLIGALGFGHLPVHLRACRADDLGSAQHREIEDPPVARRGQGRPRRAAGRRGGVVSRQRHVHVLRHRELEPAADGGDGTASSRHQPGQPGHPLAGCVDRRGGSTGDRPDRSRGSAHAGRPHRRRTCRRQRMRRAAGDRRLDQPHHAPGGDRPRRGNHLVVERHRRPVGRRAAAGPRVSQRARGRQPLPRGRRHGVRHRLAAGRRAHAPRRAHGRR